MAASVIVMFSLVPNATFGGTPSGQTYQAVPLNGTTYGVITNINPIDVTFLGGLGCQDRIPFNNYNATGAPLATDDYTVGYNTGSLWAFVQGTFSVLYECTAMGSTPGSATWVPVTGPTGATGPQGPTGPAGITWRGTYSSVTTYAQGDGVSDAGNAYVSLQSGNLNNTPTSSPSFWTEVGLTPSAGNAPLHLFIVGGQSNAQGQSADPTLSPTVPLGVYQFTGGAIVAGNDPVGNANPSSAWPAFGIEFLRRKGQAVCIVPCAVGGTDQCATTGASTQNWDVSSQGSWGSTDTLAPALIATATAAMAAALAAGWNPVLRGILWSQGENDAGVIGNSTSFPSLPITVVGAYGAGSTAITVSSSSGLASGQQTAVIPLDNGSSFTTSFTNSGTSVTLTKGVPTGRTIPSGVIFHIFSEDDYQQGFERMANYFRTTAINGVTYPELPIFMSQTGGLSSGDTLGYQRVRAAQERICQKDPYTTIAFRGAVDFIARGLMQNTAASFTASVAGTAMTVPSAPSSGTVLPLQPLSGTGMTAGTVVDGPTYAAGGGVGGAGTYNVSPSQTVPSTTITQASPSPHYQQEAYNSMGREMAKAVCGGQDYFVHQAYNVQRLAIGGALTNGDAITVTATSTAISGSPWPMGPVTVTSGATFASLASLIVQNAMTFSPNLSAAGIFAEYQTTSWGVVITFYQPKSLSPQMVLTASWTGSGSETWHITTGEAAYGQSADIAYNFGNVAIAGGVSIGTPATYPGPGNLAVAGSTAVGTALSPNTAWTIDGSVATTTIANGANVALASGSGLVLISDRTNRSSALFIVGAGGGVVLLGQCSPVTEFVVSASPASGKTGFASSGGAYTIFNNTGAPAIYSVVDIRSDTLD